MLRHIKRLAKRALPRTLVAQLQNRRHADEVAMIAGLCAPDAAAWMVDVGAHHGTCTRRFLELGWQVVAYEPDPANRAQLLAAHGDDPRVQCSPDAVSDEERGAVSLYASDVSTGISALSAFHPSHRPIATVRSVRLDADLRRRGVRRVDFLKVDAEGYDLRVLRGFDWTLRPRFVLYEFEDRKTVPLGYTLADSSAFVADQGYALLYSIWEPIREYGEEHTWRALGRSPPEDASSCWGNVLCFASATDRDRAERLFVRR